MILTIKGADFSAANIGTLNTVSIRKVIGRGVVHSIPNFVEKGSSVNWTITLNEDYEFGSYAITMGGEVITPVVNESVMTISIANVTGAISISVATTYVGVAEPEQPDMPDTPTPEEPTENIVLITNDDFTLLNTAYLYSNGMTNTSKYFDSTDKIDISNYVENAITLKQPVYTDSTNIQSPYGIILFDKTDNIILKKQFPLYVEDGGPKGNYTDINLIIPYNAKYIVTSRFNETAINDNVYDGENINNFAIINKSSATSNDITHLFNFSKTGYSQRVVASGGIQLGDYVTEYWNSATVDVSEYVGKPIQISTPVGRTSSNTQLPYGFLIEDANGNLEVLHQFKLLNDGNSGLGGSVEDNIFYIPENAKYLRVCYFSEKMKTAANPITDEILNGFYCKVWTL